MHDKPKIENAPGLVWRKREGYWVATWRARRDLIARGWLPKSYRLWEGNTPDITNLARLYIQETCNSLQAEMLTWGRGGIPIMAAYDGTIRTLIYGYQTHKLSTYHGVRFRTRRNYDNLCRSIDKAHGHVRIAEIRAATILGWYQEWLGEKQHVTQAHSYVTMLRIILKFGSLILEDAECKRVREILTDLRFAGTPARKMIITAEQANAIRAAAHQLGLHSIALAQALQFELMLRQRDVIGEWVPLPEPGISDIQYGQEKWLRGLRWSEIDGNLILRHVTSKRGKALEADLKLAPMVMEEISRLVVPKSGPVIVCEETSLPWTDSRFRRAWRRAADVAGVPANVWNMDSRAGAISEGRKAGADLESLRHAATHSDIATTTRYSRDEAETVANVMRLRAKNRKQTT